MTDRVYFLYPPIKKYFFNLKHSQPKNNKIRVMYAGRLSKDKGIDLVIDIFKCLDRNKYHLSLIGYFNNHKDIEKYKKTISTLQIDELDISESAKKSSLSSFPPYEHCDILLLPYQLLSPTLDLPLILLEGMVAGCKVITSKIGDIPHLKGNVYDVQDYTNARAFIDMIEKKSNVKIKKYNYKNISLDFIGKKYLDCLFEDEL